MKIELCCILLLRNRHGHDINASNNKPDPIERKRKPGKDFFTGELEA
jgi:hypothetical protein